MALYPWGRAVYIAFWTCFSDFRSKRANMTLLIATPTLKPDAWVRALRRELPDLDIRVWPDCGDPGEISFILAWETPAGFFSPFSNLRCIASLGAGVDHLLADPQLPASVPVTRVIDPSMSQSMSEYVILHVLRFCRHSDHYGRAAARGEWRPRIPAKAAEMTVGIMGLGKLGGDAAQKLNLLGFPVIGWRRTPVTAAGVETFSGDGALSEFLARSRILVCMLPLTPRTQGILNATCFAQLPKGAYVINVARGAHLVEDDLLDALESGGLAGACLDVFQNEPLPAANPLWRHPRVTVTPHIASLTNPREVVPQIVANYRRVAAGEEPRQRVDVQRGY